MSIIKQTYFDQQGATMNKSYNPAQNAYQPEPFKGPQMLGQTTEDSIIQQAINRLQLQIEACIERNGALAHRIQLVSRTPVNGQGMDSSPDDRGANSYVSIHLNELCDRLGELERRICLQIDLLEI